METRYLLHLNLILLLSVTRVAARDNDAMQRARLSLDEVTRAVLANNPAIKQALRKWNAMKERVPQAAAWEDAQVRGDSRVRRFVDIPPNSFMDQTLTIEQIVPISGKNLSRARIAAAEALGAFEDLRREQFDAVTKARSAYFRLGNAYAQLDLNRRNIESLRQIADITRAKYEAGTASEANVLVAQTEAARLEQTQRDFERAVSDAQSQLNVQMGRDAFAPLGQPLRESIAPPPLLAGELRAVALEHRPEVRRAHSRLQAENARVQLARRQWFPDPAIMVRGQRYNEAGQAISELDTGLSFPLPFLNVRKYSAANREAAENAAAAQHEIERAETEAIGLVRDQLKKIETARANYELYRDKLVPQGRQAFEANQFAYESGKVTFLDWITAQRTARDLEAAALNQRMDYEIALAELESVVGAELRTAAIHRAKKTEQGGK